MARTTTKRSLREYRAKRDFKKTPEPSGSPRTIRARPKRTTSRRTKKKSTGPIFCVQKHLATRLHYDFRLEHNGVLLSWAVPKGPSVNPADKRLAMHVEDHPLDYAEFEGVIPEGYGMGIVVLWDTGTWKPLVDDVNAALAMGNLKFELDGKKLKGEWALIRTSGRGGSSGNGDHGNVRESWLLIKKRDFWSADVDITELAPKSVKSKLDFEGILKKKKPEVWKSHKSSDDGDMNKSVKKIVERLRKLRGK